jgi:putative salt-induced outer membrane protein YdiY
MTATRTFLSAACATLLSAATAFAAPKVDVVVLKNGDHITCEIKTLNRGRLSIDTDAIDAADVYWGLVDRISSPRIFEVETSGGARFYGALVDVSSPRRIRVVPAAAPATELSLDDVVRMEPIEASFWQRIDGRVDLGFSFAKADLETRWTLNGEADYRGRQFLMKTTVASQLTARDNADSLSRNDVAVSGTRLVGRRWFALALGQVQENQELSLDLRSVVGGGGGRYFLQSNRATVRAYSGLVYTHEKFTDVDPQNSAEVAVGSDVNWFSARNNDVDMTMGVVSYYNVSGDARARFELQSALRVEFLSDFYFSLNGYDSYDSSPPAEGTKNDFGVSLAVGWKF